MITIGEIITNLEIETHKKDKKALITHNLKKGSIHYIFDIFIYKKYHLYSLVSLVFNKTELIVKIIQINSVKSIRYKNKSTGNRFENKFRGHYLRAFIKRLQNNTEL